MISTLDKEFDKLEQQLENLLRMVRPLTEGQQNFKPHANAWSILQIFRHLMQSEGQINKYVRKKILGVKETRDAGMLAKFRSALLNAAMRLPIRYRVPESIKVDFEDHYVYDKLVTDWRALRAELKAFLDTIDEDTSHKELFRHPTVGRMTLAQGLSFMQVHLARHTLQVINLMKHQDFPRV